MRWWISGFYKMLGSSRVAAQLAASREGLGSMSEWVKMEAICSSETSVQSTRSTRRHIPEDGILQKCFGLSCCVTLWPSSNVVVWTKHKEMTNPGYMSEMVNISWVLSFLRYLLNKLTNSLFHLYYLIYGEFLDHVKQHRDLSYNY
jgi:hypothetical protein